MKKNKFIVILILSLLSCEKDEKINEKIVNTSDLNTVNCIENTKINFTPSVEPISLLAGCIKDIDGNVYKTFILENQQWMAENLKVSKYNDGTPIPNVTDSSNWAKLNIGAWSYFNNDTSRNAIYGKLYNWTVVSSLINENKNVCPQGWHVPSYTDWVIFIDNLDNRTSYSSMREVGVKNWVLNITNSTNSSLFTALPGGVRASSGFFYNPYSGMWWITNEYDSTNANSIEIKTNYFNGFFRNISKSSGCSIRCIKD